MNRRPFDLLGRAALDPAAEIIETDFRLLVIGKDVARVTLAGVNGAATVEPQIRQRVENQELVVGVDFGKIPLASTVLVKVV